jgi:hypothetical protein
MTFPSGASGSKIIQKAQLNEQYARGHSFGAKVTMDSSPWFTAPIPRNLAVAQG